MRIKCLAKKQLNSIDNNMLSGFKRKNPKKKKP